MPLYPTTPSSSQPTSSCIPPAPIPIPNNDQTHTFTVLARTTIPNTPPLAILNLIRNLSTWKQWNTFCPHAVIKTPGTAVNGFENHDDWLTPGMVLTIDVHMNGDGKKSRTQDIEVTMLQEIKEGDRYVSPVRKQGGRGYVIAWKSLGWKGWQLRSVRIMEFWEGEGGTEFGGILGSTVRRMVGSTLVDRFGDYARDVREFFEKREVADGDVDRVVEG
ncbi:hypothetical protein GLAREA_08191 [Glarea lozoyensis ATCC 20868]|uniref:Bet v1-like protein n=1 Tax=Glarea lozoyensis (strain ATCC 20868 / MF5171) TaxID=1116229 RepID=S3CGG3_GLAL2|nr:uncharacterized protein GLAREA_08191 [Glarea lozoyensis ATCC 20868]EPE24339.1 hypothetical protein GLAREA_08191 [Glarea lozoyensis ATCC 20868]